MRRRVTYVLGGHFIALHKSMLYWSHLGASLDSLPVLFVDLRASVNVLAALFDAQAAQIRVGVLFYLFVQKQTPYLLCTGCAHTHHR